ncbi:hypothetical protein [Bacteroides muris (ex Fokt et al. 2023)]|uniref:Uncharacterized protein n=1 Tax=Bacteroides muris (ex Fokt et al. 2023) TaxID=2937417 RepID=A0A9X2NX09_9BACE|nr:hypothetical protein [Bacteroides muris (ex Fokt et al. 2023)]MCR6506242.1 hypothetical protein [Bacteroides muris (ex Fokt et al. 2023)]
MKRVLIMLICCTLSLIAYSQVPLVRYHLIYENENSQTNNRQQQKYTTVAGYYYDSYTQRFKRIKIKVNSVNSFTGTIIYLKSIYLPEYERWMSEDGATASKVNAYLDGEDLANNFEWKINSSKGIIYFNY